MPVSKNSFLFVSYKYELLNLKIKLLDTLDITLEISKSLIVSKAGGCFASQLVSINKKFVFLSKENISQTLEKNIFKSSGNLASFPLIT